jgi:hypothetical protein
MGEIPVAAVVWIVGYNIARFMALSNHFVNDEQDDQH